MKLLLLLCAFCLVPGPIAIGQATNLEVASDQTTCGKTLLNQGDTAVIKSGGVISTFMGKGISMEADNQSVFNEGLIITTGHAAYGVANSGNNARLTNNGTISTSNNSAHALFSKKGGNVQITNRGTLFTNGSEADAIYVSGDSGFSLVNSGHIIALQGHAINIKESSNPTLTLLRGSHIQGPIHSDNYLNLNVGPGHSLALTLDGTSAGFTAQQIENPFAIVGNTLAVIDPLGLGWQVDFVADLSDMVLNGIYPYRTAFPYNAKQNACGVWVGEMANRTYRHQTKIAPPPCPLTCSSFWVKGLGSHRNRNRGELESYHNWQGGFLVGYNCPLWQGDIGVLGGAAFGKAMASEVGQKGESTTYMVGASYERIFYHGFLGAALVAGYSSIDNQRYVMNNLIPDGVEKATAEAHGLFISPELTYVQHFPSIWCSPTLTATLRYAGLFLGDYTESGSLANLSVNQRNIQLLTVRGEFGLPIGAGRGVCRWEPYLGVLGRFQLAGREVEAELLDQPLSFEPNNFSQIAALLLGIRSDHEIGRLTLFVNFEASFETYNSTRVLGEGGLRVSF